MRFFFYRAQKINVIHVFSAFSQVEFFARFLQLYHVQHSKAEAIIRKRPLGLMMIDANEMAGLLVPSPLRCLDVSFFCVRFFLYLITIFATHST